MFSIRVIPTVSCADLGFAFLASMLTMQATTYVLAIESGYEQVHAMDIIYAMDVETGFIYLVSSWQR